MFWPQSARYPDLKMLWLVIATYDCGPASGFQVQVVGLQCLPRCDGPPASARQPHPSCSGAVRGPNPVLSRITVQTYFTAQHSPPAQNNAK